MQVNFFSQRESDQPPHLVGAVTLDEDGKVVIPGSLATFLVETRVRVPGGTLVTPVDGERYLQGLVFSFRGTRFWAEPDGPRQSDRVKAFKDSEGKGPKILILDPNDPEGSYQKLMEQRRKNLSKRKGKRDSSDSQE